MNENQSDKPTITVNGDNPICVNFSSRIDQITGPALIAALSQCSNEDYDEIHLLLSTPGGTVADGIAIYNFIRALPVSLITYNIGQVYSIGNVVYQAGEKRISATSSSFMFHGVGFDVKNARLELKQLRERTRSIENDQALITDIMVRHTRLGVDDLNSLFLDMAHIRADEALERGITDEILDIRLPEGMPICPLVFQG